MNLTPTRSDNSQAAALTLGACKPQAGQVCVVIVTYANRFALLEQVIGAAFAEGVAHAFVVDNGTHDDSRLQIDHLAGRDPRVTAFRFAENRGSAPAFTKGMELALDAGYEWLWVLDDDNRLAPGALVTLQAFWARSGGPNSGDRLALSSFRRDRPNFVAALASGDPDRVFPPKNAFAGFHVKDLFAKVAERMGLAAAATPVLPPAGRISGCAYGGLFCHRSLLARIGLPDEDYVLYMDDFAFTNKIVQQGGEIWLVRDSVIIDLEASHYLPERKAWLYHSLFDARNDAVAYYGLRNGVRFAKTHLTANWLLFRLNQALFLGLILPIGILRGKWRRLCVLGAAVYNGEIGRMGTHPRFPL